MLHQTLCTNILILDIHLEKLPDFEGVYFPENIKRIISFQKIRKMESCRLHTF